MLQLHLILHKNNETNKNSARKERFLGILKGIILGLKVLKQLRYKSHTEDLVLGYHSCDNCHVTHKIFSLKSL